MTAHLDRRAFLSLLLASAVAEAADWDRLLWVPKPIVTVPAPPTYPVADLCADLSITFHPWFAMDYIVYAVDDVMYLRPVRR